MLLLLYFLKIKNSLNWLKILKIENPWWCDSVSLPINYTMMVFQESSEISEGIRSGVKEVLRDAEKPLRHVCFSASPPWLRPQYFLLPPRETLSASRNNGKGRVSPFWICLLEIPNSFRKVIFFKAIPSSYSQGWTAIATQSETMIEILWDSQT